MLLTSVMVAPAGAATPRSAPLSVLEQGYTTSLPVDVYGDESSRLHVAVDAGQAVYRSYVLLGVGNLSAGGLRDLRLTLVPDITDTSGDQNMGAASLMACPLVTPPARPFDPSQPPPYDCSSVHVTGVRTPSGDWSFSVLSLLRYWQMRGVNTGLVVLPATSSASDTWAVAFSQKETGAQAVRSPAVAAGPTAAGPAGLAGVPNPAPAATGASMPGPAQAVSSPSSAAAFAAPTPLPQTGAAPPAASGGQPAASSATPSAAPIAARSVESRSNSSGVSPWWLLVTLLAGGVLALVGTYRRVARARATTLWRKLAPPETPRLPRPVRFELPAGIPVVGGRTLGSDQIVNFAVIALVLSLAWAVSASRLPHGAPSGVILLGITFGSLNGLLAVGLVLIYRATRIINFAQGALGAFAAVLAFELMAVSHWPWAVAVPLSLIAATGVSALVEFAVLRRLQRASRTIVTVATIGIAQLLTFLQLVLQPLFEHSSSTGVSAISSRFPSPFSKPVFSLFPVLFSGDHIVIFVVIPVVLVGLHQFLSRTWTGMGVRAIAENVERATMLGWPAPRLSTIVWGVAGLLSAVTALLRAPMGSFAISGNTGPSLILHGLAAAAIGRMTSIPITFVASLGLGVLEQVVLFNYSQTAPMDGLLLLIILVAFLAQSRKLSRSSWNEASSWRSTSPVRPVPAELRNLAPVTLARRVGPLGLLALAVLAPVGLNLANIRLLSIVFVYAMVGVSLVVLTGWAGQISLGQWGIAGVGCFTTAWLANHSSANFIVVLILGAAAAAVVSVLLGLPALRIRGIFAGITTLAFAIAAGDWFFTFGGLEPDRQVPRPRMSWLDLGGEKAFYYVVLAALVVVLLIGRNLRQSRVGRLLISVSDNEQNAAAFGVSATTVRLTAFAIAGSMAGLAGGIYSLLVQRADPSNFDASTSLFMFAIVVIGGLGSITGAVLGAFYIEAAQYFLPGWARFLATGIGMLVLLLAVPGGLSQLAYDARDRALRRVAERRGLIVPSLVADRAHT